MLDRNSPIESYLDAGERLLWSGQPKQGVRLQASDVFLIPFSLMWGGFALFWEAGVLGLFPLNQGRGPASQPPVFMALWGIPFVCVGLYMMVGRFFGDAAQRRRTWYAITDRRVIIYKKFFSSSITSLDYGQLNGVNLVERGDRSGDITFGATGFMTGAAGWNQSRRAPAVPGFYLLPDARPVYDQIRSMQSGARK